jgi:hypothetical protein
LLVDFGSFHSRFDNVINDSFNYTVTRHRWNCRKLKYIIFRALLRLVARLFMFLLIFNEQRVLKFTFVLVLTYYVNHSLEGAPHLFVILTTIGWSIVNIQSDLFWHRCLERQTFGTPRMYTLSPSKSIKRSNYGEFLKDKNVLLMYTTVLSAYKYDPNLESFLTQQYVCVMCTLWSDNTCVFTRFYSVNNANTQLIWSSETYQNRNNSWKPYCLLSFNMGWQDISKLYTSFPLGKKY